MNRKYILPTSEEERAINTGIAADPDTRAISSEEFKKMRRRSRPLGSCIACLTQRPSISVKISKRII